ncbi:hypothetical protein [Actinokineospora globicatena]|uniref:hypothetical protein n=1 Tax=Actinokineospora globicatena TaxID=103729 RepID=UPI0020A32D77|nr:hypothetical protein [Actinokineospora globicatena]MCP2302883.1 hypothetical protein [Actinokineospora globicatena]GLW78734.1 hypothetical protein Aglo01_32160 [Actinokineospora globicatena]GLW84598.1 hypothetical protein Aglo02_22380 [Actinokineospora globicatena]
MTHPPQDSFWARVFGRRGSVARPEPRRPDPVEQPRTPAVALIAEARARGEADARKHVRDGWSFTDAASATRDAEAGIEDYANLLRERGRAAVASARDLHLAVLQQTAPLREQREEARERMTAARQMMSRLAGREAWLREPDLDRPPSAEEDQAAQEIPDDDPAWEGETTALGLPWRVLILTGLVAALSPVHYLVFQHFLSGTLAPAGIWALGVSSAVLMVVGPHVAALMLRSGRATGSDRTLVPAAVVLGLAWATMAVFLGLVAAAVVSVDHVRLAALDITGTTLVVMVVAGLLVGGAVSFMIGLARRHPFQEAYAESRRRFEELDARLQATILHLDPGFADFDVVVPDTGGRQPETLIEAIEAAYRAAEYAYFDALSATTGDPTFTEAVEHRLGLPRRAAAG